MGYWMFLVGVVLGFLGLVTYYMTEPASMGRGVGYALAAMAPALLMSGAVLRFPLRRMATFLVAVGLLVTFAAIAWFLSIFPTGWSLTTGDSTVIMAYVGGLAIIGVAGSIVPLATDPRDAAVDAANERTDAANQRADSAEHRADSAEESERAAAAASDTARKNAADKSRDSQRAGAAREEDLEDEIEELTAEIEGMEEDDADVKSSKAKFELYTGKDDEWRWRLVHHNGNIIADSGEGYSSKANAKKGLGSVKLNALGAETDEL